MQLQADLLNPRVARCAAGSSRDLSKCRGTEIRSRVAVVHVIDRVESLPPGFQLEPLRQSEGADQGGVDINPAWPVQSVPAQVAEGAGSILRKCC